MYLDIKIMNVSKRTLNTRIGWHFNKITIGLCLVFTYSMLHMTRQILNLLTYLIAAVAYAKQ